jgi:S-adenosylmethionine synthetase
VQLAYAIGVAKPVSVMVDTFGTNTVPESAIMRAVESVFDLTPRGIMKDLDLRKPIYEATAAYGHFGREPKKIGSGKDARTLFSWERLDRVKELQKAAHA